MLPHILPRRTRGEKSPDPWVVSSYLANWAGGRKEPLKNKRILFTLEVEDLGIDLDFIG